jgi:hypothetical protein
MRGNRYILCKHRRIFPRQQNGGQSREQGMSKYIVGGREKRAIAARIAIQIKYKQVYMPDIKRGDVCRRAGFNYMQTTRLQSQSDQSA